MTEREFHRAMDLLTPDAEMERRIAAAVKVERQSKRKRNNWKRVVLAAAAAALLVTTAMAALVPGLSQRLLEYLGVAPEDAQTVELLAPGAMAVDITKEDNGAALRVTQILRDRNSVMVLADFIAPEGTVLNMGDLDAPGSWMRKGFSLTSETNACFMDEAGTPMGDGLVSYYGWEVLEDDDPLDNHITALFVLYPQAGEEALQNAATLRVPAADLSYFDSDGFDSEAVYYGDWTVQVPLPQQDIGYAQQADQVIGEPSEAGITLEEVYLSPMALELTLTREGREDLSSGAQENEEVRWRSLANSADNVTLTSKDGMTAVLELGGGGRMDAEKQVASFRLSEITDPTKFQGGTLTLEWDFSPENSGFVTILLDNLSPVEAYSSTILKANESLR